MYKTIMTGVAAVALLQSGVLAQDFASSGDQQDEAVLTYAPEFFAQFSPTTVLDMLAQVPGFSISSGNSGRRGLGDSFGNVLIDGTRPSNKGLSLETILQRIAADDVLRIELIRRPVPEYDMRGHAQLINIVRAPGAGRSGSWSARAQLDHGGQIRPGFDMSQSLQLGQTDLTLGLDYTSSMHFLRRDERLEDAAGNLLEARVENAHMPYWSVDPSLSIGVQMSDASRLLVDVTGSVWESDYREISWAGMPAQTGLDVHRINLADQMQQGWDADLTLDYEHGLQNGMTLQTVFFSSFDYSEYSPMARFDSFGLAGFNGGTLVDFEREDTETVLRQTGSWTSAAGAAWEVGVEAAFNARDNRLDLYSDNGSTVQPVALPVSTTRVEERRAEIFGSYIRDLRPDLNLELGLRYEFSEISQSGDAVQERTFGYLKPRLLLTWNANDRDRWQFSVVRDIFQLNFGRFASAVDISDGQTDIGNPNYEPEKTWTVDLDWQRRISDGAGSIALRGRYMLHEDVDDAIPVAGGLADAPGNIGNGHHWQLFGRATLPLDGYGISNAVLSPSFILQKTIVEDPVTGEDRSFSGWTDWTLSLDFRQTFPEANWAWGWDYNTQGDTTSYRATERRHASVDRGDLDIYVETTRWLGVTMRLSVDSLLESAGNHRERIFFSGSRADGIINRIEYQDVVDGPTARIQIRNTF